MWVYQPSIKRTFGGDIYSEHDWEDQNFRLVFYTAAFVHDDVEYTSGHASHMLPLRDMTSTFCRTKMDHCTNQTGIRWFVHEVKGRYK